jgi:hypothetical protein
MGSFYVILHDAEGVCPEISLVQEFCQGHRILNTLWDLSGDFFPLQTATLLKDPHIGLDSFEIWRGASNIAKRKVRLIGCRFRQAF